MAEWSHQNNHGFFREVSGMKLKKLYSVGLGFVLFLCVGVEPLVNLLTH